MSPCGGRRHDVPVSALETIVDCRDLDANLHFFLDRLGWRISLVTPADDPTEYVVEHPPSGGMVRLRRSAADIPVALRIVGDEPAELVAPNGTIVSLVAPPGAVGAYMEVPDAVPSLTVTSPGDDFGVGRAGMTYRDLLPDRWGGRFIASHIRIDHPDDGTESDGGEVADWVHFHRIRFQMIYVAAGWVDVVYEDQGEPFRMHAGDCVLQPPRIRHRVLRSSPGLEVIEVGCPAEHDTIADPSMVLPNGRLAPVRDFDGQRFVRHVAADADWSPWLVDGSGFVARDTGVADATNGLAGVVVVRPEAPGRSAFRHDDEFVLLVGLGGHAELLVDDTEVVLPARGSVSLPPGSTWRWTAGDDHEALVVSLPADAISLHDAS